MPNKYDCILTYIEYFEDSNIVFCKWDNEEQLDEGAIELGYPDYDKGVTQFIKDVYSSDLIKKDYLEYLQKYLGHREINSHLIRTSDFELLKAILTYYVRQERFCDGLWATAIKERVFLEILYRMQKLTTEELL